MSSIKFGTDGWRAIIGRDFTPQNVQQVIQAFCDWRRRVDPQSLKVVLGFDRRLQSDSTARLVAEVLAGNQFQVLLSAQYCPTPCVSWMVKNSDAMAGIMVTASHNPAEWNGIKFKEAYGGSASPEYTGCIEDQLSQNLQNQREIRFASFEGAQQAGLIEIFNPHGLYNQQLAKLVDLKKIQSSGFKVLYDSLYGAGAGYLEKILGDQVEEMHFQADPYFGGLSPEPIKKNLPEFLQKMQTGKWHIGLATDGDADRIGAADEAGNYVDSHHIFALLLKHYVEDLGISGSVVKSVSTTQMIPILCKKYDLEMIETPIGFKHICKKLVEKNALIGGEESGGISFKNHVHERDGLLNGLMLLNMMAHRQKTLGQLLHELQQDVGSFFFERQDFHVVSEKIAPMQSSLAEKKISSLVGVPVQSVNFVDGFKYICTDESWLLIRASGTEPLVRIYAEARTRQRIERLLQEGRNLINNHT